MLLLPQKVGTRWVARTKRFYVAKGYNFTSIGEILNVDVLDLPHGSEVEVKYKCDYCGEIKSKPYKYIFKALHSNLKDCCGSPSCQDKKRRDTRVIPKGESLAEKYPHLANEWDYSKNEKSPYDYYPGSNKKVWWKCHKNHSWKSAIEKRSLLNRGCHYCAGRKVDHSNSLKSLRPQLVLEWDYNKNRDISPSDVTVSSGIKAWWTCSEGHSWRARISSRNTGSGCPYCKVSTGEKLISEWLEKNNIDYKREVSFDGLVGTGGKPLRFDFAILDNQEKIIALVEFDGIFHFRKLFKGDGHEMLVKHDKLKNEYCERVGLWLIRISYEKIREIDRILGDELFFLIERRDFICQ